MARKETDLPKEKIALLNEVRAMQKRLTEIHQQLIADTLAENTSVLDAAHYNAIEKLSIFVGVMATNDTAAYQCPTPSEDGNTEY